MYYDSKDKVVKQKTKMTGIVYCWHFPTSKREAPYYIGKSFAVKPMNRANCHKRKTSKLNKLLAEEGLIVEKDGILTILHKDIETDKETWELEGKEIAIYDCQWPNGFNFTNGGHENVHCEEARENMSKAKIGYKHSEETKKKIRENNPMKRSKVVEKQAASRMRKTISEYKKWRKEEDKRIAARAARPKPKFGSKEHFEKQVATRMGKTVPEYKEWKVERKTLMKKYGWSKSEYSHNKRKAREAGFSDNIEKYLKNKTK